jgi:hypothetical protein
VLHLHARQVIEKWLPERRRQHRHAILAALAVPNRQLASIEVDGLHTKLGTFEQPQPRAYMSDVISHTGPRNRESNEETSSRERTTGRLAGRCARTISGIQGNRWSRTTSNRKKTALSA